MLFPFYEGEAGVPARAGRALPVEGATLAPVTRNGLLSRRFRVRFAAGALFNLARIENIVKNGTPFVP